eukprot:c26163_g1_i1 orf=31-201(-)
MGKYAHIHRLHAHIASEAFRVPQDQHSGMEPWNRNVSAISFCPPLCQEINGGINQI